MECQHCGQRFDAVRSDAKFCSVRCRVAAHRNLFNGERRAHRKHMAIFEGLYFIAPVEEDECLHGQVMRQEGDFFLVEVFNKETHEPTKRGGWTPLLIRESVDDGWTFFEKRQQLLADWELWIENPEERLKVVKFQKEPG
jgi:predicted nucleic acid-binding Zn ribbon protein